MELQLTSFRKSIVVLLGLLLLLVASGVGWSGFIDGQWDSVVPGGILIALIFPFFGMLKKRYIINEKGIQIAKKKTCFIWEEIDHIVIEWIQNKLAPRSVLYLYHQRKTIDIGSLGYRNFSEGALLILEESAKRDIPVSFGSKMFSSDPVALQVYKDWLQQSQG